MRIITIDVKLDTFPSTLLYSLSMSQLAHYQTGGTALVLVWKDEACSQYVIDTDNKGQVPIQQPVDSLWISIDALMILVVLELQDNGQLVTSDDPPVVLGCLNATFIQEFTSVYADLMDDNTRVHNGSKQNFIEAYFTESEMKWAVFRPMIKVS
ncbi:hypothetical protein L1987_34066 [Smallanthus sonchifolius]|uniref:Uncharacterized protein n=1 Tax=Smallanthus sonchifolius TaxID=185202 RepID=A0ACB9HSI7_9ASTR|nr:hypothetical protein L1987_34066 [Smallanthus sonchifolius]